MILKLPDNFCHLSTFQRILLTTDGTVTKTLEVYLLESIQLIKLTETSYSMKAPSSELVLTKDEDVISRKILLQGQESLINWIYAESIVLPNRLEADFKKQLMESQEPIGQLWNDYKIETFKEILSFSIEEANELAEYFNIKKTDPLLCRSYRVFSHKQPIMKITEKFPKNYFT